MNRGDAVQSIAAMIASFAVAFFVTALLRQPAPFPPTARTVPLRTHEKALAREGADLRRMSRSHEPIEPAAAGNVPAPKGWNTAIRREYDIRVQAMVVKKMRKARRELGLTEAQLASYEMRLRDAAERDPMLPLGDWDKSDREALAPLLDSLQHARYLERVQEGIEQETRSETQVLARALSADPATATVVSQILREEGVVHRDEFLTYLGRPREAKELLVKVVAAMDRVRVRTQPLLSPEERERLDRYFADETGTLEVIVEEIQRAETALKN